ncbi:MAG: class I SAM-dependent methyltransferase [Magnetococcus sp. YQC-3]
MSEMETKAAVLTTRNLLFPATAMPSPEWWHALWPDPTRVLELLGLHAGMTVVDLCCGDGYFTAPLARLVNPGRVIGVDLDPELLEQARSACREQDNCQFFQIDAQDLTSIMKEPVECVFIANTLHGVPDKAALLRNIFAVLREGGCLAIINWHPLPREQTTVLGLPRGPATGMRLPLESVRQIVAAAGFAVDRQVELPPYHYGVVCRKPEPAARATEAFSSPAHPLF